MIDTQRLLSTFLDLVQIDNPSGEESQVAAYAEEALTSAGFETRRDDMGNLVAWRNGAGEPILLSAHMDSVQPCKGIKPVVSGGIVTSSGDTILGADDRAGVAAIIEGVRSAVASGAALLPIEIVFSVQEETGLRGAKGLDCSKLRSKSGVAFDADGSFGDLIISAPSQDSIAVTIHGKPAHAGIAPEKGINAIVAASKAIARMPLGRIDQETTSNVGIIKGGLASNIVPETVEIKAEARSRNEEKLAAQTNVMVSAFREEAEAMGASADVRSKREYTTFLLDANEPIVQRVVACMKELGATPNLRPGGGGSDANIFNAQGIVVCNASPGYRGAHSTTEQLSVADMEQAARLVALLVRA